MRCAANERRTATLHRANGMSSSVSYLVIGLLTLGIAVIGYLYYDETRSRSGIEIQIDENGVTMEEK
jgi:hypothetical protein